MRKFIKMGKYFKWICNIYVYSATATSTSFISGFPSVGKSTLLTNLSGVFSEVAAYEFTTLTTVPGVIRYIIHCVQLERYFYS